MPLSRIPSPFTSLSRKVNMQDRAVIYRNLSAEQPVALYRVDTAQLEAAKVVHQKIHSLTNNTFDLVVFHSKGEHPLEIQLQADSYPKACLSNHPTLMDGLNIAATSWFDFYSYAGWKTMQASTYFSVDKSNPTVIRLRPSLRVALDPADCPGIDNFIRKQSRKRTGTALVSPPKKAARTETNPTPGHRRDTIEVADSSPTKFSTLLLLARTEAATPSHHREIIEIPDSPPATSSTFPSTSRALIPPFPQLPPPSEPTEKRFPDAFYLYEHDKGWREYDTIRDSTSGKSSIPAHFARLFPRAKYSHTTVTLWRNFFLRAPLHLKQHYVALGRTEEGSWKAFVAGVRNGLPLPSSSSTGASFLPIIVKSESQLATVPAPVPSAPLDMDPVMSLPSSTPTPRPDTELLAIPAFGVCDFCDIPLTIALSAKLIQLTPKSHSVPMPANPNHCVARTVTPSVVLSTPPT
ncbi:hypothetical protein DFH08DRAFT_1078526 [Mycena albidolilacea]|uniref:Uncharacterized protein n=1 Tax=Mycena albidolilacea TaxID=1033008 RepID=A0AAD7A877_9AGAR|nr:hypothetical protein DFH08DRAFT_993314 [Mycena albidolilacea]KAJ7351633.1 hypothetical protein DFH08DRAFT_1078526 [Mycena albidolilacea]